MKVDIPSHFSLSFKGSFHALPNLTGNIYFRINEARLSFPSGHSSMAFYGMVASILILAKARRSFIFTAVTQVELN